MHVKTYRAKSMQEALAMVRRELGPDAAVLHTRQVRGGVFRWLGGRRVEVTASTEVHVPSRMSGFHDGERMPAVQAAGRATGEHPTGGVRRAASTASGHGDDTRATIQNLYALVEDLCRKSQSGPSHDMPQALFRLFTDLIEAEVGEDLARELVQRVQTDMAPEEFDDTMLVKARIARQIEDEIATTGRIQVALGQRRVVALVGPTGVGKTTTIAKLAANYRLKEKCRVGLITVDTYRIAAVDQLRTYADIMDLPMEVVSSPKEMRQAAARLAGLDLVFLDTAGRSPRDELKIQELKCLLSEAQADEVHLVLSGVASAASLAKTAEQFAVVGTTALIFTKLDEATGLGNLLPVLRSSKLPLSYVTDGQNVPDDIQVAESRTIAKRVLGMA